MALVFIIDDWDSAFWLREMAGVAKDADIRVWPDCGSRDDITYAMVWKPAPGALRSLKNLEVIFSLGAGVDHVFADPELPAGVPIVRIIDPDLTMRMAEYVVLHVLMHHRRQRAYDEFQRRREWKEIRQPAASETRVGILGFGVLGQAAGERLRDLGFQVAGWSRTAKSVTGIESFAGAGRLDDFLARTEILVSLLPHTRDTAGILDYALFARLARDRVVDGPVLINAGRGQTQNEADILKALDDGTLHGVTLDVFEHEPLPAGSALWTHPRVTITPHNASVSDPRALCRSIWRQIERHRQGLPLQNVVDPNRGY